MIEQNKTDNGKDNIYQISGLTEVENTFLEVTEDILTKEQEK